MWRSSGRSYDRNKKLSIGDLIPPTIKGYKLRTRRLRFTANLLASLGMISKWLQTVERSDFLSYGRLIKSRVLCKIAPSFHLKASLALKSRQANDVRDHRKRARALIFLFSQPRSIVQMHTYVHVKRILRISCPFLSKLSRFSSKTSREFLCHAWHPVYSLRCGVPVSRKSEKCHGAIAIEEDESFKTTCRAFFLCVSLLFRCAFYYFCKNTFQN